MGERAGRPGARQRRRARSLKRQETDKTHKRRKRPPHDPLLRATRRRFPGLSVADPPLKHLVKGEAATGTPTAGRSAAAAARRSPIGFLHLLGPGLITGASDDDPSGVATYSQVGSQFGYGLLWTALFTFPLMAAVQELCARTALQTGEGLGTSLRRKFPTWVVAIAVATLCVANTINLGADLGAVAAGGSLLSGGHFPAGMLLLPIAGIVLALQLLTSYSLIFRLFKYLTVALLAYVVTLFLSRPNAMAVVTATVTPHVSMDAGFIAALVAVLGTTISPYLFFWQASSEVDEMKASGKNTVKQRRDVTNTELRAARTDVLVGMGFSQLIMYCIIAASSAGLYAHGIHTVSTAAQAAQALRPAAGPFAPTVFAIGLIGTGMLAIPILSASSAYAVKELTGLHGSLAVRPRYRPIFYGIIVLATLVGLAFNFFGVNPIAMLFITAVINGVVCAPLLTLIVLLGADRRVMRRRTSGRLSLVLTWTAVAATSAGAFALVLSPLLPRS